MEDELECLKARIERIARDLETDHRSGKMRSPFSDALRTAKRLREALTTSPAR